jgi:hypothetical protein
MCTWRFAALSALALLSISCAGEQFPLMITARLEETDDVEKRAGDDYISSRFSGWMSSNPMRSLTENEDIAYLLQYLEKRGGEFNEDLSGDKSIRSPLGTMRFGKRDATPLGTMRFGKRDATPLGTMRFGKRESVPLGTMRFGKRESAPLGTMRFGKRESAPLGTMRFGRR